MKKVFGFFAMMLAIAACNKNEIELPVENAGTIPFTATISVENSAATKALAESGSTIEATWAAGEKVALIYTVGTTTYVAEAEVTPQTDGTATISTTLDGSPADDTDVTIVYPASAVDATTKDVKTDLLVSQNGLLTGDGSISKMYDLRKTTSPAKLKIDGTTASLKGLVSLTNQFAIFKFTIQDISATAQNATEFKVSDGSGNVITTVTPSPASGELYVALPVMAAGTYWFNATIDSKPYIAKATTTAATSAGNYYQTTVKMATLGDVILSTGKFAAAGTDGSVAKIVYVGSDTAEAAYNHGLALALSDANSENFCNWKTSATDAGHTKQTSSTFTSESGLQYNATHNTDDYPAFKAAIANNNTASPTGCSAWFLASGYQWAKIIASYGIANLKTTANGYTCLSTYDYWSSSESSVYLAWRLTASSGTWNDFSKDSYALVRSCLAF
ncbi:MAG: hypothetical protein J6Y63_09025 [Bacteroidales bacterium]|nr:hypothetical protein [Bacteroidales bacterium]